MNAKTEPNGSRPVIQTVEIERVIADPAASDLLRFLCAKYLSRDPVDAAGELAYAARLFGQRADAMLGRQQ
jgi:hypothetical protein